MCKCQDDSWIYQEDPICRSRRSSVSDNWCVRNCLADYRNGDLASIHPACHPDTPRD